MNETQETHHDIHDQHHNHGNSKSMAASATLHCLTGCAIGEILGLIIGTAVGLSIINTIILAITLAFVFGYSLSTLPLLKTGVIFGTAFSVVFAADTLSTLSMEVAENIFMASIPGAMEAGLNDSIMWLSMAGSLLIGFAIAYPVNLILLNKGKGHALTHEYHGKEPSGRWKNIPVPSPVILAYSLAALILGGFLASSGLG